MLVLLLTTPPVPIVSWLPLTVKGAASESNASEWMLQLTSTFGVVRVDPAKCISAVPLLTGSTFISQFASVVHLSSVPPPSHVWAYVLELHIEHAATNKPIIART